MKYYVYILRLSNNKYYTGITHYIVKRLCEHNEGKVISTKGFLPAILEYNYLCDSQQQARKLEVIVKSWSQSKKRKLIFGEWILN